MSDPSLSDIDFKNKMTWVWITLQKWRLMQWTKRIRSSYFFDCLFLCTKRFASEFQHAISLQIHMVYVVIELIICRPYCIFAFIILWFTNFQWVSTCKVHQRLLFSARWTTVFHVAFLISRYYELKIEFPAWNIFQADIGLQLIRLLNVVIGSDTFIIKSNALINNPL